jgi:putative membrane protein
MSANPQSDPRVPLAQRRTGLAAFRTSLSLERTTLAWIRTTLAMTTFGLGLIGFFRTLRQQSQTPESVRLHQSAIHFGVALVLTGVVSTVLVSVSHLTNLQKLDRGETPTIALWPLCITIALLLAIFALAGLWFFYVH